MPKKNGASAPFSMLGPGMLGLQTHPIPMIPPALRYLDGAEALALRMDVDGGHVQIEKIIQRP